MPLLQHNTPLHVDTIASTAARCGLTQDVVLSSHIIPQEGYCVAVRALHDKQQYNQVECADGSFKTIKEGDLLVGALGERQALKGYSGRIPRQIHPGDHLHVLNLGGIVGQCTSDHPDLGPALEVEVLGSVLLQKDGQWSYARIQDHAIEPAFTLEASAPLIMVSGTSMNTGKTKAACALVQGLTERGFRVATAKLTGAALRRDTRTMKGHGAIASISFTDAGVVASTNKQMAPFAKGLITHLNDHHPDVCILELGDGFIGYYGVDELLRDKELQRFTKAHVVAAVDLAGAWAADHLFRDRYRSGISVMTGPVTDNAVGKQYIRNELGIPALNAQQDAEALTDLIAHTLETATSPSWNHHTFGVAV